MNYRIDRQFIDEGESRTYKQAEGVNTLILISGAVDGLVFQRGRILEPAEEVTVTGVEPSVITVMSLVQT